MSILFLATSCDEKIDFEQIKASNIQGLSDIQDVVAYKMRFNPQANAYIIISLSNEAEYKASKLSPERTSAILSILSKQGLKFDTLNNEFLLNTKIK